MKLVLQVQLLPAVDAEAKLRATTERFNAAANWLAGVAFEHRCANAIDLQKRAYRELRDNFGLSSQTAILVVRRVCEAYKRDKSIPPEFRPDAAITYDVRTISFKGDEASLLTLEGRIKVPMRMGEHQQKRFGLKKGQADLVRRKDGKWFLAITVDVSEDAPIEPRGVIGVDLGVKHLAVTDNGESFTGDHVEACRKRYTNRRKGLNRCGTKSARRRLCKIRKKESRFRANENHVISKRIVSKAKGTGCAIAVEDLTGIADRTTVRKADRSRMKGWAFFQLRQFIAYKAALAGIPVVAVDPRNTSRTCSSCGHCEKANRKTRDEFACKHCRFELAADWNAARNIRDRGKVMCPLVGVVDAGGRIPDETAYKPVLASPRL